MKWPKKKLAEVASFQLGKMLDEKKNKGVLLPYLANVNVRWGQFDIESLREMRFEDHELERYGLKYGDIVMCEGGEPGRCAIWKDERPSIFYQKALHRIRPNLELLNSFLYYQFLFFGKTGVFEPLFTGATIKHMPREQLAKVEVSIPPLPTQQKIAAILSAYDDLIENNLRRIRLLEEAAQHLYREWFVRFRFPGWEEVQVVDGLPEGWEKCSFFDVAEIMSGGTPKTDRKEFWDGEIPFFTAKDASSNGFTYINKTEKNITEEGLKNCNSKLYEKNTVFITARGTVGKVCLTLVPMAMSQSCYALKGKNGLPQLFLCLSLKNAVEQIKKFAVGGVFDTVIVDTFKKIPFIKPPGELANDFERIVEPFLTQTAILQLQTQKLKEARDILLPRLMSRTIAV